MAKGKTRQPMAMRNYRPRVCVICGETWNPQHPRSRRCPSCQSVSCTECGKDISASIQLHRHKSNPRRMCMECYLASDSKQISGGRQMATVGTRRVNAHGYITVKGSDGQWRLEHRVVMEGMIGRELTHIEQVHHLDSDKTNNAPSNLVLCANLREHLDTYHADQLVDPPLHHNGRKRKGTQGWEPIEVITEETNGT